METDFPVFHGESFESFRNRVIEVTRKKFLEEKDTGNTQVTTRGCPGESSQSECSLSLTQDDDTKEMIWSGGVTRLRFCLVFSDQYGNNMQYYVPENVKRNDHKWLDDCHDLVTKNSSIQDFEAPVAYNLITSTVSCPWK